MDQTQVTTEGKTIGDAVRQAAEQLGVPAEQVRHKLDVSHFKTEAGRSRPVDTVKVICWAADPSDSEGAVAAKAWLEGLIKEMNLTGTIKTRITGDKQAVVAIDSSDARFLVGRRGATLNAIRTMLSTAMAADYSDWQFKIDVDGGERRERDDDRRGRDRGDRGDRGRGRDRGDRGDRGGRRSERDVEDLKRLARKLAERVADEGGEEILRKPLNSFERRVVHMEIADMAGVDTATIEVDGERKVRIFADEGAGANA